VPQAAIASAATFASASVAESTALARRTSAAFVAAATLAACAACRTSVTTLGATRKGFFQMKKKRHSVDQIVSQLRKADVELGKGKKVPEVCKELEVTE
jgi:hypothetical protein